MARKKTDAIDQLVEGWLDDIIEAGIKRRPEGEGQPQMSERFNRKLVFAAVVEILREHHPMTLRQIHYQLVSRQVTENTKQSYHSLSKALIDARKAGIVPWGWMEDRLRRPRHVNMWEDIADFGDSVSPEYRRNVWATQPSYLEFWVEKDALSGIFEDTLEPYGITLNVGRGYDGWSSIKNTADRLAEFEFTKIIYFGDFDPSGEDMVVSLEKRLRWFGKANFKIEKAALTRDDIDTYNLPPNFTKRTDTRAARHIELHGDISVELDALSIEVLRERIIERAEANMDLRKLAATRKRDAQERKIIQSFFEDNS